MTMMKRRPPPLVVVVSSSFSLLIWLLTVAAVTLFLCSSSSTLFVTAITEREVLLEFYQATGGPKWKRKSGWADNAPDLCSWHGVLCVGSETANEGQEDTDNTRQRSLVGDDNEHKVIGLALKENNLVGRTPPSLYKLSLLESVYLSFNPNLDVSFLGGEHAKKLVQLKLHSTGVTSLNGISHLKDTLQFLHVSSDHLHDTTIPLEVYQLTALQELHLAANQFQGTIAESIASLSSLRVLNLFNNNLSGTLPYSLANLKSLEVLTLTGNQLTGTLPLYFSQLTQLQDLNLDGNFFKGPLPALSTQTRLERIFLNDNDFSGTIPSDFLIASTANPIRVDLDANRLTGTLPSTLDTSSLQNANVQLTVADNFITGLDASLCDNVKWMDQDAQDVEEYGCDAIACPVGTYGNLGRQTSKHSCKSCTSAIFVGQRYCLDSDDKSVLQALYVATQGAHWIRQDGWMQDNVNVCDWYGVACWNNTGDASLDGKVRHLNLDNNNLYGIIPPSIFALKTLTAVTVSNNPVKMQFDAIAMASRMHKINVANTDTVVFDGIENAHSFFNHLVADRLKIGGTIPSQIMKLSNLQTLSMSDCHLEGTISTNIGNMRNLTNLYLHGNWLTGSMPTHVGLLSNLKVISLAKNKLTGVIPGTVSQLTDLEAMSLSDQMTKGGGITGELIDFAANAKLNAVFLARNQLEGTIPANLLRGADLDASLTVDVSTNTLTGTVPGALSRFANLNLQVQDNYISGIDKRLCVLDGWMNGHVRDYGCDAILCPSSTSSSTGKRMFANEECSVCSVGDDGFYGQTSCGERDVILTEREILQQLYDATDGRNWHTSDNWYTNAHYCEWYGITCDNAKSVVNIVLGSNKLQGRVPTAIYQLPNLQRLSLFSNDVQVPFEGIENARNLRNLILDSIGLESLDGIGNARGLRELNVRFNKLGSIPTEIQRLVHLEALELSSNNLTGPLPSWLGKLPALDTFVVANNRFAGPLVDFSNNANLIFLDVSNNELTGVIPTTLLESVSSRERVFVDLSNNRLNGMVPADLQRLKRLQIHLQDNQITSLAGDLCNAGQWQDSEVEDYGCDAIACPIGTYNIAGRQSYDDGECVFCKAAKYMGQTKCSSGSLRTLAASAGAVASLVAVSTVYLML